MQGAFLPDCIGAGLALAALFAVSYIQIRHVGLAAAAAFAPLPGCLFAVALHAPPQPFGYLCGFMTGAVLLSTMEARICDGAPPADALRQAIRSVGAAAIWPLALVFAVIALLSAIFGPAVPMLALLALLSGVSALAIALPAARYFPCDEDFIVRANRLRERRERWLDGLAFVIQPRWGWSVGGIALILAVLGFFGGRDSGATWPFPAIVSSAESLLFVIIAFAAIRNVRRTIAFLLVVAVLASLAFWICGRSLEGAPILAMAIAVAATPSLMIAVQSAKFARAGDRTTVAALRASEQLAIPIIFLCLASSIALFALGAFAGAILVVLGGVAALIVFPALTTAIHDLFPPRASLDAYRIH